MIYKVVHLTSVHPRYDVRIFHKICSSLAKCGNYDVSLVVADGKGNENKNGIKIIDVGSDKNGLLKRLTKTINKVYQKALELDCDIYHLHDPELILVGKKLLNKGKIVVFDAHEDLPKQILGKHYLPYTLKFMLSKIIPIFEKYFLKKFSGIICATPYIKSKFIRINQNSIDVNNYPLLDYSIDASEWERKPQKICYVGGIDKSRGIYEIIESLEYVSENVILDLAGNFKITEDRNKVSEMATWNRVNELGYLNRGEVLEVYKESKVGIVTLHPQSNYLESLPVKMFEYMAAGIPVVASDFPIWRKILYDYQCGICVNPLDAKEIGEAITKLITNDQLAKSMGENGKAAINEKFNWKNEERKLLAFYNELPKKN